MATSRTEAQQRADDIRVFRRERDRLLAEGIVALDPAQRQAVDAHHDRLLASLAQAYDIDRDTRAHQLSLGMRVASFLGALALAAAVMFLFFRFFGYLGTGVQVALLVTLPLATLALTLWVQQKDATGYFTKLAGMVAFACFVLDLVLLGTLFNITPSDKALVPWAAFALLLAYAADIRLLLAAGILCLVAFISARTGTWSGMYWIDFGTRPENFLPAGVLLFLAPLLVPHARYLGFAPVYRVFGLLTVLLPVLVLGNWGDGSYLRLDTGLIEGSYQVLGFALSALVIMLGARRDWPDTVNTGITFFVIFLYTKLFDWWWNVMPKWMFFLVLALTAILVLLVLRRLRGVGAAPTEAP